MQRVMCVWFPRWPLQRLFAVRPELKHRPVVLYGPAPRGGWQVRHCSKRAVEAGVIVGMPLAEAKTLLERLAPHIEQHDAQADLDFLRQLAGWCDRFSPLVGFEEGPEPQTLVLNVTGCAPLFGGEEPLARQVVHDFTQAGFFPRVALADTIGAAWGTAHFGHLVRKGGGSLFQAGSSFTDKSGFPQPEQDSRPLYAPRIPPGEQRAALSELPVAALRLPENILQTLDELDVHTVGRLCALPRSSVAARFGDIVARRIDEALGNRPEIITPVRLLEPVEAEWSFEEPVTDRQTLDAVLRTLLDQIAAQLALRQEGALRLECRFFGTRQQMANLMIGSVRPRAAAAHLWDLFRLQLERTSLPEEVLRISLEATSTDLLETHQPAIIDDGRERTADKDFAVLLERLCSRLGERAVLRPRLVPDAQPELALRWVAALRPAGPACRAGPRIKSGSRNPPFLHQPRSRPAGGTCGHGARPLRLKPQPVPIAAVSLVPDGPPIRFQWQGQDCVIRNYWGPERIETGWWRGPRVDRDYYRVETAVGQRFWLFRRNRDGNWFLHGVFE
jgi:protein ImuB